MALSSDTITRTRPAGVAVRPGLVALIVPAVIALVLVAMLAVAPRANLTSDESLYLAEAYNIAHGEGLTYPSREPITHRAPLYPALMAPFVRVAGADGAYAVSKAVIVLNVALVALLAWRLAGAVAAVVAGGTSAASAYLNGLGLTLYVDPLQCTFMLATLLALHAGTRSSTVRWFALAGCLGGLAFLAKESAVQWAPLGVVLWLALPGLRSTRGLRAALAYSLAFALVIAPWWAWVYAQTGTLFLLGEPSVATVGLVVAMLLAVVALYATSQSDAIRRAATKHQRSAPFVAMAIVFVWCAVLLVGLTRYSTWPYPNDYLNSLPDYLTTIAPAAQPYLLLVLAWPLVGVLAWRGDGAARIVSLAAMLFAPFAIFAANRGLQLRDALPIVYLSYVALGVASAWVVTHAREFMGDERSRLALAGLCVLAAVGFGAHQALAFREDARAASPAEVRSDSWDSSFVRASATWMEQNIPTGSRVLTSRLYFSSLHVHTDARFEIRQLPTVRARVDADAPVMLTPASNLFRWGDEDLRPSEPGDSWIYLRQFYGKGYWAGLSQQEFLEYVDDHGIEYVVLTGEDVAFSSLQLALYLARHPAFTLLHHERATDAAQLFAYRVDPTKLTPIDHDLAITPYDLRTLEAETGLARDELSTRVGTPIHVTDLDFGLSATETAAALKPAD